jgi:2'-5' RNA ligase
VTPGRLANHWVELAEWSGGRELWAFYLTFPGEQHLHAYVERCQGLLRGLGGLDLVDPAWLHLTVQGVAFVDVIDANTLTRLKAASARVVADEGPVELAIHRPACDHDSITMAVSAGEGLLRLRDGVRCAARAVLDGSELYELPEPIGGFSPHITIAYARSDGPSLNDVEMRLRAAEEPPVRVTATYLSLLRLNRDSARWWWREELRLPMRAPPARVTGAAVG